MELETYVEGNQVVTRAVCLTPYSVGSIRQGETALTVRDPDLFVASDEIVVRDAGAEGGHLWTEVVSVSGYVVTVADAAGATVTRVRVGTLTDPGTRTFTARRGDDAPTVYTSSDPEVDSPRTGVWELRLVNDERDWVVHFQGTTPCHCAGETAYRVRRSRALA